MSNLTVLESGGTTCPLLAWHVKICNKKKEATLLLGIISMAPLGEYTKLFKNKAFLMLKVNFYRHALVLPLNVGLFFVFLPPQIEQVVNR